MAEVTTSPLPNQTASPTVSPVTSPVIVKADAVRFYSFHRAMEKVVQGEKISRAEWKDEKIYGFWNKTTNHLMLHKADGDHDWIINDGDMLGNDWMVV